MPHLHKVGDMLPLRLFAQMHSLTFVKHLDSVVQGTMEKSVRKLLILSSEQCLTRGNCFGGVTRLM